MLTMYIWVEQWQTGNVSRCLNLKESPTGLTSRWPWSWSSPITSLYSGHQRRSSLLQVPGGRRVECGGDWEQGWEGGQQLECDGGDYVWCNQSVKQCFQVKKSDFEVFEALACDSFSLKNNEKNKSEKYFKSDSWCQVGFHFDQTNLKSDFTIF